VGATGSPARRGHRGWLAPQTHCTRRQTATENMADEEDTLEPVIIEGWSIVRHGKVEKETRKLHVTTTITSPPLAPGVLPQADTHEADNELVLVLKESTDVGTGGWVWQGAMITANFVTDPASFATGTWMGKSVLELGAGIGHTALVLASLGAAVVATDQALVVPLLAANLAANEKTVAAHGGSAAAAELEWAPDVAVDPAVVASAGLAADDSFDYIVACDCLKCNEFVEPLAATLRAYAASSATTILFSYEERGLCALDTFYAATAGQGDFEWTELVGSSVGGGLASGDRAIWSMRRCLSDS